MSKYDEAVQVLQKVIESPLSDFYRDFYRGTPIALGEYPNTKQEWERVPTLTKADLMRVPLHKRLFVPMADIESIVTTSGTTGAGLLATPRLAQHLPPGTPPPVGGSVVLSFHYFLHITQSLLAPGARIIAGDRLAPEQSATLAKAAGADALVGPVSVLLACAPAFTRAGVAGSIRHMLLVSERCTALQEELLRKHYPHATIVANYGMTETGIIALCPFGAPGAPKIHHALPHYVVELVDEHGTAQHAPGSVGEITITTLGPAACPLVRYRTGDIGKRVATDNGQVAFEFVSRANEGSVRIPGGTIFLLELERALRTVLGEPADFEATVDEVPAPGGPKPALVITLIGSSPHDLGRTAAELAGALRVNGARTYHDGVVAGLYAPLFCKTEDAHASLGRKRRHLRDLRV